MSTHHAIPLPAARAWARKLAEIAAPACQRVEVVGSVRRGEEVVGDIELLVEPVMAERPQEDMFADAGLAPDTQAVVDALLADDADRSVVKGGSRFVQVRLASKALPEDRPTLDIFFVHPPASWGAQKVIRTGPSSFSRALVTRLRERGWRNHRGAVWKPWPTGLDTPSEGREDVERIDGRTFTRVPTPTEKEYFRACGLRYIPPERRGNVPLTETEETP